MTTTRGPTQKQLLLASTANQEEILRRLERIEAAVHRSAPPAPVAEPAIEG